MNTILRTALATASLACLGSAVFAQDDATGTPLEEITQEMKVAANQLSKKTTDKQTQTPQTEAIMKIDKLIAELEKERMSLGSGTNPRPTMPANSSTIRNGPGGMGDLHGAKEQGNRWGDLPAHERDRILQSLTEGFPPHYQAILEAYYKRLAAEKRAEDSEPPSKDGNADAKASVPKTSQPANAKSPAMEKKAAN